MKCPECNKDVQNIRILYKDGEKIEGCLSCTNSSITWWYDPKMKDYKYMNGKGLSVGYIKDVENRGVDRRTGEVYDKRKYSSTY